MKPIGDFLELYPKYNTRKAYTSGIFAFLDHVYHPVRKGEKVTEAEREEYEALAEDYLAGDRDHLNDVMRFVASKARSAPHTQSNYAHSVREWLAHHGHEIQDREWRRVRTKFPASKRAATQEKDLDHDTLRSILTHMDLKARALVLVLASSGMRIGEALQITLADLNMKAAPAEINIRREITKTGGRRTVFISREAAGALAEWLKVREAYLRSAVARNGLRAVGKGKVAEDPRIFPFSVSNAEAMWARALEKAGLASRDTGTNRRQLHPHQLRKFFRSQLALAVPVDIVEALMGHEAYLASAYRRFTHKQLAEYYLKGERMITLLLPKEIQEIETKFGEEVGNLNRVVAQLSSENIRLRDGLEEMREKVAAMETITALLEKNPEIRRALAK